MKKSKKVTRVIGTIFLIVVLVALTIMDYFDLLNGHKLNMEFWSAVIPSIITVTLFYITFKYIDKREIQKNENKKAIARKMLMMTYKSIGDSITYFENKELFNTIIKHVDYDKNTSENDIVRKLLNMPFTFDDDINKFTADGILSGEEFEEYIDLKNKYSIFVTTSITFFDVKDMIVGSKERQALTVPLLLTGKCCFSF